MNNENDFLNNSYKVHKIVNVPPTCIAQLVKVIVPTVVMYFFQSVTIQKIHVNKYIFKNTFH